MISLCDAIGGVLVILSGFSIVVAVSILCVVSRISESVLSKINDYTNMRCSEVENNIDSMLIRFGREVHDLHSREATYEVVRVSEKKNSPKEN